MTRSEDLSAERIARALGSSRVVELGDLSMGGPLDWLHLRAIVAELRKTPATVDCRLSVSEASWRRLVSLAAELQVDGQALTPTELARVVLERGVEALARRP
jgi:hypothetical protein